MEKVLQIIDEKIRASNKQKEMISSYKKLCTDEERIVYTLKAMLQFNVIPETCSDNKNDTESEKLRQEGNKIFVSTTLTNESCLKALELYSKSIAYAPYPSEQLALAYGNRSAVLKKIHEYELCIQDIERALELACPSNSKSKLLVRKVECLKALHLNLGKALEEAQCLLEKVDLDSGIKKRLTEKLNSEALTNVKKQTVIRQPPLPKIKTCNIEVPSASDAVAIKYNTDYGRHIVATRKLDPGEVIAVEKPYALILNPDNFYTHCSNCLEVSWASIPCDHCIYAMYCSEKCKEMDWKKYHDVECAVFSSMLKLNFIKLDLFSLRLAVQAVREAASMDELRKELEEVDNCDDPRTKGFSKDKTFPTNKYRSLLGLVTNTKKRSVQDLFRRSLDSCFILYYLATHTNFFGEPLKDLSSVLNNPDATFVGGLILRHQQMIPSNSHTFSELHKFDLVERGIAAVPFFSLFNHSCNPNILRHSRSQHMVLYVLYPINEGEQLFDTYSQFYPITPKDTRQKELLRQYYFNCNCVPCQEDWPLYYDTKSISTLVENAEDRSKITHALRNLERYIALATVGNVTDKQIVDDLLKIVKVLYELAPMPCEEMNNVIETLKRVYDLNGNRFEDPELY